MNSETAIQIFFELEQTSLKLQQKWINQKMQKQYTQSQCSDDKYSIYSKSGRKLYRRINNNIRVLNKSKLSNKSNNSIGSVALRRTQLSNDKIYSRQEDILQLNSSQMGVDLSSAFQNRQSEKGSVPLTPLQSMDNYKQRLQQHSSNRSIIANSQKSYRGKHKDGRQRRVNRQEIQKLLMLEGDRNEEKQMRQDDRRRDRELSRRERELSRRNKQSMRSSRQNQSSSRQIESSNRYNGLDQSPGNKLRSVNSIKSIKSSHLKPISSRNVKQPRNHQPQIQHLYQKYIKPPATPSKSSRSKQIDPRKLYQQKVSNSRANEKGSEWQDGREKQRMLQKYQSEKYLGVNDSRNGGRVRKRYEGEMSDKYLQDDRGQGRKRQDEKGGRYREDDRLKYSDNRYKQSDVNSYYINSTPRSLKYQHSLQKYQQDQWARSKYPKRSQQYAQEQPSYYESTNIRTKPSRQDNRYHKVDMEKYKSRERSSILEMRSKFGKDGRGGNIRIREEEYGNLYGDYEQEQEMRYDKEVRNPKKPSSGKYRSPTAKYPSSSHQYYHHLNNPHQNPHPILKPTPNSPQTQISTTFDSLMLSINSHITSNCLSGSISTKSIIEKVNLHVTTLQMIADYTHEFKKMYENIEEWEELVFMTYKKFWVERVKVVEYLKRFKAGKRHQSERMQSPKSRKLLEQQRSNHKLVSLKNISSDIPNKAEDPFADSAFAQNPFIIPFCKITQPQLKSLLSTPQGLSLLSSLQHQNTTIYQSLQQMYNLIISKSGNHINMLYCDNFSDEIYVMMLEEIEQLIPNLEEFKVFQVTKIRLGKIVKVGILILFLNGKVIRNMAEIVTYDDCEKIGQKKKIKTFTTYDLYYEVFEKLVVE